MVSLEGLAVVENRQSGKLLLPLSQRMAHCVWPLALGRRRDLGRQCSRKASCLEFIAPRRFLQHKHNNKGNVMKLKKMSMKVNEKLTNVISQYLLARCSIPTFQLLNRKRKLLVKQQLQNQALNIKSFTFAMSFSFHRYLVKQEDASRTKGRVTHCRMSSTASSYFIPASIKAIATSTGALKNIASCYQAIKQTKI